LGVGAFEPPEDLGRPLGQQRPGRGEPDPAPGALQQLRPGLGLEPREMVADRRLRVVELLRGPRDRAVPREGFEDPQPGDVQHLSIVSMNSRDDAHWTYEVIRDTLEACHSPASRTSPSR